VKWYLLARHIARRIPQARHTHRCDLSAGHVCSGRGICAHPRSPTALVAACFESFSSGLAFATIRPSEVAGSIQAAFPA
jgi:hypothetical protein